MLVTCIILLFKKYLLCGLNGSMFPKNKIITPKIELCKINIINICTCKWLHTAHVADITLHDESPCLPVLPFS